LQSLREIYRDQDEMTDTGYMPSEQLAELLNRDKEAPWFARSDKGITLQSLSIRLKRYRVKPDRIWNAEISKKVKGYPYVDRRPHHSDLKRVFEQYLPKEEKNKE
jgi:hypothetical protein